MRLLNTATLRLETFLLNQLPSYAILSHTWTEEEVLFEDLEPTKNPVPGQLATNKTGVSKILNSARLAAQDGHRYIWIDTCCIDKSSSAELSEAINSMFRWYMLSAVCYAHLADLDASPSDTDTSMLDELRCCRWFTRGWTLQEMIAPGKLIFFNKSWTPIGTRAELASTVEEISTIPRHILASDAPHKTESPEVLRFLSRVSVSTRLGWAGRRQTQRIEDEAYSLMGIFGVNMPLIYGEGSNAFQRLQEELIRISDDQSILTFRDPRTKSTTYGARMFAESPSWFLPKIQGTRLADEAVPMSLTNRGLELDVLLCNGMLSQTGNHEGIQFKVGRGGFVAILQCGLEGEYLSRIGLVLWPLEHLNTGPDSEPPRYFRRRPGPGTVLVFEPDKGEVGMCEDQDDSGPIKVTFEIKCCVPKRIFLESPMDHSVKIFAPPLQLRLSGTGGGKYEFVVAVSPLDPSQIKLFYVPFSWCLNDDRSQSFWGYALIRKKAESGSKRPKRGPILACCWRLSFSRATDLKGKSIPGLGVIACLLMNKVDLRHGDPFKKDLTTNVVKVLYHENAKEIELAKPCGIYKDGDINISALITKTEFLCRPTYKLNFDIGEAEGDKESGDRESGDKESGVTAGRGLETPEA